MVVLLGLQIHANVYGCRIRLFILRILDSDPKYLFLLILLLVLLVLFTAKSFFLTKNSCYFVIAKFNLKKPVRQNLIYFLINKDLMITIPCCVAVVQNLAILYQGKRLTREEEECQHLLASKEKCPAKKKRKTKPILPKIYTFFAFWRIHICYNYFFRKKCHRRKNCSGCNW